MAKSDSSANVIQTSKKDFFTVGSKRLRTMSCVVGGLNTTPEDLVRATTPTDIDKRKPVLNYLKL